MTRPATPRRRPGFTLIELMVVVVIIALLVALLVPAVLAGIRTARNAAVQTEISLLATALVQFKSAYGDYPPSRVVLNEAGVLDLTSTAVVPSGADADITVGQLGRRTVTAFRKFWPRAVFNTPALPIGQWYDFNGNNNLEKVSFVLQGSECLVFFLGGIPTQTASGYGMSGFSKNPTNPFMNNVTGSTNYSANRTAPLFEFVADRLVLSTVGPSGYGSSLIPGYIDSLNSQAPNQAFYAYFSLNVGNGYDPNDMNIANGAYEVDSAGSTPLAVGFKAVQPTFTSGGAQAFSTSPSPNPYTNGSPLPTGSNPVFLNPQSFQIVSPGADGGYGVGGMYVPNATPALPNEPYQSPVGTAGTDANSVRALERDNLTNFHNGRLE
jgi:general secretion pathway protein G